MGELDPNLIGNVPKLNPDGLFGSGSPGDDQNDIARGQLETLHELGVHDVPLPGSLFISEVLKSLAPTFRLDDYYGVVGDAPRQVNLPVLAGGLDMWILDRIVTWGNPANNADVTVQLGLPNLSVGGAMFKVPMQLTAPKAAVNSITVGLPVDGPQVTGLSLAGTAKDQAAIIFVYRKG